MVRKDYDYFTIQTSFLAEWELNDIIHALRNLGFYVIHFHNEHDFIKSYFENKFSNIDDKYKIVYTSALNDIVPGKRSFIPSFCSYYDIPTANSNPFSCTLGRNKFHVNKLLKNFGIPVPDCWLLSEKGEWLNNDRPPSGLKIITKATYEGSSLGVTDSGIGVYHPSIDRNLREIALKLKQPVTVQELISGYELEVPVIEFLDMRNVISPIILTLNDKIALDGQILSYEQAYEDNFGFSLPDNSMGIPLNEMSIKSIMVSKILNFKGYNRIDFRVNYNNKYYVIDIASTPHLTVNSSFTSAFESAGYSYEEMLLGLITVGLINNGYFRSQTKTVDLKI